MGTRCSLVVLLLAHIALGADLFDTAKRLARTRPADALALLPQLTRSADRAEIQRLAIQTAAAIDPPTAARELPALLDQQWIGSILFADAARIAPLLNDRDGQKLLIASAIRHPETALQDWQFIARLPYAAEVLAAAAVRAPDEAVELLASDSEYSRDLNVVFAANPDPALRRLVELAHNPDISASTRVRLALHNVPIDIAGDTAIYFHTLANARLSAAGPLDIAVLDRALTRIASQICRAYEQSSVLAPEIARLAPSDLYLLLAYSRPGDEDTYFAKIFDRQLAPHGNIAAIAKQAGNLRAREFFEYVLWFQRYSHLLRASGGEAQSAELLSQLFRGLDLDNALTAADAIATTPEPIRRRLRAMLAKENADTSERSMVRLALTRSLSRPPGEATPLPLRALGGGTILERYFFYDDADGVESFDSFKSQYAHDPAWHWEDHNEWVRLTSRSPKAGLPKGSSPKPSIEIVANVPVNAMPPNPPMSERERLRREQVITDYLGGRDPAIIVHRGHAYHVEKTLTHLTRSTRLVFLGSCRGLGEIRSVIDASPQADIISTRAVGTKRVNDPLLKSLNQAILQGVDIQWPRFWSGLSQRFAGTTDFPGYIPPHRNGAAAFMRTFDGSR